MLDWMTDPQAWIALGTLTALEIVLGVDNIIFISILVGRLPEEKRQFGRIFGLGFALVTRLILLASLSWIMRLTEPLFTVFNNSISGRDIILIIGGLFLIAKSTHEMHRNIEGGGETPDVAKPKTVSLAGVIFQVGLIDIIFSIDSVVTAVGMVNNIFIMILAIVISIVVMMFSAKRIGLFVDEHSTIKMLALSFLILIGVVLIGDGLDMHIPKGYVYFAMAYAVAVELLNIRMRRRKKPLSVD